MVLPPAPPNMTYKVEKLNPLAFPKGMDLRCELTGKPALVPPHGSKRPRSTTTQESHGPRGHQWRAAGEPTGRRAAGGPGQGTMLHCMVSLGTIWHHRRPPGHPP